MNKIGILATDIWNGEFKEEEEDEIQACTQIDFISGWLSSNLGNLNVVLHTNFSGCDPDWGLEAPAIFYQMYMKHYYKKQARNMLKGINRSSDFIELRDADTAIKRNSRTEAVRHYGNLVKDSEEEIKRLITKFHQYEMQPLQVVGRDASTLA